MAELRRHTHPDQPDRVDHDERAVPTRHHVEGRAVPTRDRRVPANIQQLLDLQNPPKRRSDPNEGVAKIKELLALQNPPKRNAEQRRFSKLPVEPRRTQTSASIGDRLEPVTEMPAQPNDRLKSRRRAMMSEIIRQADNVDQLARDSTKAVEYIKRRQYTHLPSRPPTGEELASTKVPRATPDRPPHAADTAASIAINAVLTVQAVQTTVSRIRRKLERQPHD